MKKIFEKPEIYMSYFDSEEVLTGSSVEQDLKNGNITFNGDKADNPVMFRF